MAPLQVLTLNTWGLWLVSKKRYNRILHLAEFLANDADETHKLDVVLLQEVWVDSDARILATAAQQGGLAHSMHFRSGVFGSGLLTLSRYPITDAAFHQYHCAGDPASITCGDYLAAKGVGWIRLATPSGYVDVFNTHLHANYSHKYATSTRTRYGSRNAAAAAVAAVTATIDIPPPAVDEFAAFRMAQVLELTRFVRHVSSGAGAGPTLAPLGVVLGGDLNCEPDTLESHVLRALLPQLHDAWQVTHGSLPAANEAAAAAGHTCNAQGSSFKPRRQRPSRIDYVLTSLRVVGCELALQKTPQGHSFSDHIAVHVLLEPPSEAAAAVAAAAATAAAALEPSPSQLQLQPQMPQPGTVAMSTSAGGQRVVLLLHAAREVLVEGVQRAVQTSAGHLLLAFIMFVQATLLCFFEPVMSYIGHTLNPIMRQLLPAAVLVLAGCAALFLLTGLVADAGQARALQQALQQLEVALSLSSSRSLSTLSSTAAAAAAAAGSHGGVGNAASGAGPPGKGLQKAAAVGGAAPASKVQKRPK